MEYTQELDKPFKNLGFMNFKEFVKTASPYTSLHSSAMFSKNAMSLDDLYSDPDHIGYRFIVDKEEDAPTWYIRSIRAAVQIDTIRNIKGAIVVGKECTCYNHPIPAKDKIRKEVMQLVLLKELEERLFEQQN